MSLISKVRNIPDSTYKHSIAVLMNKVAKLDTQRNYVLTMDFFIEEDTAVQDEFELFKYIYERKNSPFVPFYIMNENSPQYAEIKVKYGENIVPYNTKHTRQFAITFLNLLQHTKFVCGGFQVLHSLGLGISLAIKNSPYIFSIFTQHGVNFFKDNFIDRRSYSQFLFDKIMISNDFEKDLFMDRACYSEENLIKNGLFRWDLLKEENIKKEKSIFIYFTHRRYLHDIMAEEEQGSDRKIEDTVYLKTIKSVIAHPVLKKLVEEEGYTVKCALHHSVVAKCGADILGNVHILTDEEIFDAKLTSSILITDYSSMAFEMWFQKKPVVFLNIHDAEDAANYHHKTDLVDPFSTKKDYLYNVCETADECMDLLSEYAENGFEMNATEAEKSKFFFYFNDNFCERFYNNLLEMKDETKNLYNCPLNTELEFSRVSTMNTAGIDLPIMTGRYILRPKTRFGFYIPKTYENLSVCIIMDSHLPENQRVKIYVNDKIVCATQKGDERFIYCCFELKNANLKNDGYLNFDVVVEGVLDPTQLRRRGKSVKLVSIALFECEPRKSKKVIVPYVNQQKEKYNAILAEEELKRQENLAIEE